MKADVVIVGTGVSGLFAAVSYTHLDVYKRQAVCGAGYKEDGKRNLQRGAAE